MSDMPTAGKITADWGERCPDYDADCPCCTVWAMHDEIERLRKALETAQTAMHDWLHIYAPDECKPEQVEESRKRVWAGGTLGYIADVTAEIRSALDAVKER